MTEVILVKHSKGAPWLRLFGLAGSLKRSKGIMQLEDLLNSYTFWAKNRNKNDIKVMLANSDLVVTLWLKDKLIGFGRATSDYVYRGVLWDIVIKECYQGEGYGKIIVEALLKSKVLRKVEKIYLMTTNKFNFYSQLNFEKNNKQILMQLNNKTQY